MRVAVYARVSTTRQAQAQSIEQQLDRLCRAVTERGWTLDERHEYRDDGYSGASLGRPGLDRLRDHAALADLDVVLVTAPDRLARNYVHQVLLLDELGRHGLKVEFLDHPTSWSGPTCARCCRPRPGRRCACAGPRWSVAAPGTSGQALDQLQRQQQRLLLDAYLAEVVALAEFQRKRGELDRRRATLLAQQRWTRSHSSDPSCAPSPRASRHSARPSAPGSQRRRSRSGDYWSSFSSTGSS